MPVDGENKQETRIQCKGGDILLLIVEMTMQSL